MVFEKLDFLLTLKKLHIIRASNLDLLKSLNIVVWAFFVSFCFLAIGRAFLLKNTTWIQEHIPGGMALFLN